MRASEHEIHRLADAVVRALLRQGYVHPKVTDKQLVERIARLMSENFKAEGALEAEAETLAAKLGRQALGMDQRKLIEGIKARLAKERGFAL